jgi:hypothetical protein
MNTPPACSPRWGRPKRLGGFLFLVNCVDDQSTDARRAALPQRRAAQGPEGARAGTQRGYCQAQYAAGRSRLSMVDFAHREAQLNAFLMR